MSVKTITTPPATPVPADDLRRPLKLARPQTDMGLPHIGLAGDTYTVLLSGTDTGGRYTLIDMHVPPGGGPQPHRHDFEESFVVLSGTIEATFRGEAVAVTAGQTLHVPSNAPHSFTNASDGVARLLCLCSPAGQEDFFEQIGVRVATPTTPPPKLDEAGRAEMMRRAAALAAHYRTELLKP